jgi:hypothetical protein
MLNLLVWNDGVLVKASEYRCPSSYVFQRIHTLGYKPSNIHQHILLLREGSAEQFGFMSLCEAKDAENIISRLLQASRVSPRLSCAVVMRLDACGHLSFEVERPTFYSGATLRAKRMRGAYLRAISPIDICQNSVTEAIDAMCDNRVRGYGDIPLWVDANDEVISRPWRPIFAVYGNVVYSPKEFESVEYVVARDAITRAGYKLVIHSLPVKSMQKMDEVFEVDIMGVTSFNAIGERRYMFLTTSQIADKMLPKP